MPPELREGDALLLDFDGTLVEIAARPDDVVVPSELPLLLTSLQARLGGALAIVTGRLLQDVDQRLAPVMLAGAGLHGSQIRRAPNDPAPAPRDPRIARIVEALLRRFEDVQGILVEDKGAAVALHFRLAPLRVVECRQAMADFAETGIEVIEGHCVLEARPDDISKAHAVRMLCDAPPFLGRRPILLGDDRTDEDGFSAALVLGGHGIKVGPGNTKAVYRLGGVRDVHAWLRRGLEVLS